MHRIEITHLGNVGNRMIQYAFARQLSRLLAPCEVINVDIPDWSIKSAPPPQLDRTFDWEIRLTDFDMPRLPSLLEEVRKHRSVRIQLVGFFQDLQLLPGRDYVSTALFPHNPKFDGRFDSSHLLINIRAGDVLRGYAWYPLVPVEFYVDLVARTGLTPVFIGQVGPSHYARKLREKFPDAAFISTGKPIDDFALMRSGQNICVAVSTFSWIAAWLSEAKQIFLPLLGFLNPVLTDCYPAYVAPTNLAPVDDLRYRFFLFPLIYGLPEQEMLAHYEQAGPIWREIPGEQVRSMKERWPVIEVKEKESKIDGLWYVHQQVQAGWEIAEGLYRSPAQHFAAIGSLRGYAPTRPFQRSASPNVGIGKRATQSSISRWSNGKSVDEDALLALNGDLESDYGFHTDCEDFPWWLCDLGSLFTVDVINIHNRKSVKVVRDRASPLHVETSIDGEHFETIYVNPAQSDFGSEQDGRQPLQLVFPSGITFRYLRLEARKPYTFLHLAQVEIFGHPASSR